jgi:DNA-binding response OmpR family regulator
MIIQFLSNLMPTAQNSTPMPAAHDAPRPLIIKLDAKQYRIDTYSEGLIAHGFQVVRGASTKDGIKLARRVEPDLIIVFDNLRAGMDATKWLHIQHSDSVASLAMTPLLIVATSRRATQLTVDQLPGRVQLMTSPVEVDKLVAKVQSMLTLSDF